MTNGRFPEATELSARGTAQARLHAAAAAQTRERFGRRVFIRAVVEVSNYCRENCHYCGMRRDNRGLRRYRAQLEQLQALLVQDRPRSITDLNIQSGEDPVAVREVVLPLIRWLRRETPLGISVCLGTLDSGLIAELRVAGAEVYIVKFEMADADDYRRLAAPGALAERLAFIRQLAASGWRVSSGFIAGLPGLEAKVMLENFRLAASLPLVGCSVSPFIPGESTPLNAAPAGDAELSLNSMAALRLMRPDWVIPAVSALNLADPRAGYVRGLQAGANLCTINLTPSDVRGDYLLYKRDRFIMSEERVLAALEAEGLEPAGESLAEFYAVSGETAALTAV